MSTMYASRAGIQGRRRDGTLVKGIIPQFDGSTYAASNCGACAEASRVVSQQKNVRPSKGSPWPPTGASIRRETGDTSGGLNPTQTTLASEREYGVNAASPRIDNWTNIPSLLWKGYAVDLLLAYGPIDDYRSGSPGFRGNHRFLLGGITDEGIDRGLSLDSLYDGRRSGIPLGPQWIPLSILRLAAGRLDLGGGTTINERYGYGKAYYIPSLTRIAPPSSGDTLRVKVTCDTIARRGASIDSDKLGNLNDGDVLTVTATSEGGHWSGCGKDGTKWRKFTHINGTSTTAKWDRAYAYCAAGLTDPF
jgi:hypothetical protein